MRKLIAVLSLGLLLPAATAAQRPPPLMIVDSVWYVGDLRDVLDPDSVQNIEVVVGAMAAGRYGDKSRNGVVIITTKSGVSDTTSSAKLTRARRLLTQLNARDPISASPAIIDPPRNPPPFVHVVDDLVVTPEAADEAARTQRFTRIEIIRGTEAAQLYGTRAAPGVIIITTR